MAKINVTVTTQEEESTRFDELLKASRLIKDAAEKVRDKTQPFIDAAGEAKFDEIARQCKEFIKRAREVFDLIGYRDMSITCKGLILDVYRDPDRIVIRTMGGTSIDSIKSVGLLPGLLSNKNSFITTWNDFDRIGTFEQAVEKEMEKFINRQECDMRDRVELFNKITK